MTEARAALRWSAPNTILANALSLFAGALVAMSCAHGARSPETLSVRADGQASKNGPPPTRQEPISEVLHGEVVQDPFRWLESTGAEVQAWATEQNAHARRYLDTLPARASLEARLSELLYLDAVGTPVRRGSRYFFTHRFKDKEKSLLMVREQAPGSPERVVLDPNTFSADGSVSLRGWYPSWDGRHVAFARSDNNADEATLYVRDVDTQADSAIDVLPGARYAGPSWTLDHSGFFYEFLPRGEGLPVAERPGLTELRFHRLGTPPATDQLIFPPTRDAKTFLSGGLTRDGRWLVVGIQFGWTRTELYVRDMRQPLAPVPADLMERTPELTTEARVARAAQALGFVPLFRGQAAVMSPTWWDGAFYALTNHEAPGYRILRATPGPDPRDPFPLSRFTEIVPESDAALQDMSVIGGRLVLHYLRGASSELSVHSLQGVREGAIELPATGSVAAVVGDPDRDEAFFSFSSFTTPPEVQRAQVSRRTRESWSKLDLPLDTSRFSVRQVWYPSKDGTRISMFLVEGKNDGNEARKPRPTLLYGYGGFNVNMTPDFSVLAAIWVEQGGVYATPNLRGGGEYGEHWHQAGMLDRKQNVFDDFIAAGEYLVGQGITTPKQLGIYGGSNGGLLVGAAMTQRPDLFGAVVCAVPLLDMVRYHQFGSGKTWIEEYGSADDPAQFRALYRYSPYHHVQQGVVYPPLLMMAADSDDRVDPLHARKFVAAVQAASGGDGPHLFRLEENAGHGGGDMVKKRVASLTDLVSFLRRTLGG